MFRWWRHDNSRDSSLQVRETAARAGKPTQEEVNQKWEQYWSQLQWGGPGNGNDGIRKIIHTEMIRSDLGGIGSEPADFVIDTSRRVVQIHLVRNSTQAVVDLSEWVPDANDLRPMITQVIEYIVDSILAQSE